MQPTALLNRKIYNREGRDNLSPQATGPSQDPPHPFYLVLLMLLQQLAAVAEQLLQAQLRLPAFTHTLGKVCHKTTGEHESRS